MGRNYYNEIDKFAARWLKELIREGLIPDGDVDERSIEDVRPEDLAGYTQCHFFAGIGGWPRALRLAGWPEDREVWTGSCPCQPFSVAGVGKGAKDKRHLWPEFARLIFECRPSIVLGEQVASPLGRQWCAGVRLDLEAMGYAVGAADLCAAGVGAPHIRQRLWWVADANGRNPGAEREQRRREQRQQQEDGRGDGGVADADTERRNDSDKRHISTGEASWDNSTDGGQDGGVADSQCEGRERCNQPRHMELHGREKSIRPAWQIGVSHWQNSTPIPCADGKWRRVPGGVEITDGVRRRATRPQGNLVNIAGEFAQSGSGKGCPNGGQGDSGGRIECAAEHEAKSIFQPLVARISDSLGDLWDPCIEESLTCFPLSGAKIPGRVGLLKGAGNAIVPQVAAEFIRAFMETETSGIIEVAAGILT